MVDLVHRDGHGADEDEIRNLLGLKEGVQDAELFAARANMVRVVQDLHDPSSEMLARLIRALRDGKLCLVDISKMRGAAGLALSGIVLRHIFSHNQDQFTRHDPKPVPTIAVIEEAQSVLGNVGSGESAYEEWVKEGRKYNLGAVLITQQPGSIPHELLSQGDSWFVFHLLSQGDLRAVKTANAHFSDDLLSSLLNEPLPGNGVFWSSVSGDVDQAGNAYPIPMRVMSFEQSHAVLDPQHRRGAEKLYAAELAERSEERFEQTRHRLQAMLAASRTGASETHAEAAPVEEPKKSPGSERAIVPAHDRPSGYGPSDGDELDRNAVYRQAAIAHLLSDEEFQGWIRRGEIPWVGVKEAIKRGVDPDAVPDLDQWAYELIPDALDRVFGRRWSTERKPRRDDPARTALWVVVEAEQQET